MKIAVFYHSSLTDTSLDIACYLRGVINELLLRGHMINVFKRPGALVNDDAIYVKEQLTKFIPFAKFLPYPSEPKELEFQLSGVELVFLIEPNVDLLTMLQAIEGHEHRKYLVYVNENMNYTEVAEWTKFFKTDLLLASSESVVAGLEEEKSTSKIKLWPISLDLKVYKPLEADKEADIVWIDSYQPDRKKILIDYLINSIKELKLKAVIYAENYPPDLIAYLNEAGIEVINEFSNLRISELYGRYKMTIHFPNRNEVHKSNFRLLQALASGIPVIAYNCKGYPSLLSPGKDFLLAKNPQEMKLHMAAIINTRIAEVLTSNGLRVVSGNFSITKRVKELEAEGILPESKNKATIAERKAMAGVM